MSAPVVISSVSSCDLASQVSTVSRIAQSIELIDTDQIHTFDLGECQIFPGFSYWS